MDHLLRKLAAGAPNKFEFIEGNPDRFEGGLNDLLIILSPKLNQLPWSFQIVKHCMQICQQYCHLKHSLRCYLNRAY